MQLTILGTSAAYAGKNDACSSYLLTVGDTHYLIDVGSGAVSTLQNHVALTELAGILLSHLHPDHISDLFTMRYALFVALNEGYMKAPVPLYLPRTPESFRGQVEEAADRELELHVYDDNSIVELEGLKVEFLRTRHAIEAYGMRLRGEGKTLVFTSDTAYFPGLVEFTAGADLLLSEATLQNVDEHLVEQGHMTAEIAGKLATEAGVPRLVLTHIWPPYDRAVTLEEAGRSYQGELSLARQGHVYTI
jgi:ribonuclease BN (tRNA processing enzyme)